MVDKFLLWYDVDLQLSRYLDWVEAYVPNIIVERILNPTAAAVWFQTYELNDAKFQVIVSFPATYLNEKTHSELIQQFLDLFTNPKQPILIFVEQMTSSRKQKSDQKDLSKMLTTSGINF